MPSNKVKLQGKILLRASEAGAFEDLAERYRALGPRNVSTATKAVGEPLRKGVCAWLGGWGYGSIPGGADMVYALGLRHHESAHVRAFGPKELVTSPTKGGDRRRRRGRGRR